MSGYLPCGGFKWFKNVDNFDVNSISGKILIGYIDLEYPDDMHYTMIIHYLQKNLQFTMPCCQIIVKKLQTNMG